MSMQTQSVRDQHIVPQLHLKQFADVNGWLWRYKRNVPVKRRPPRRKCWSPDFYECDVNGRRTENRYERWLREIENKAAPILKVLANRRQLTQPETVAWAVYVASLFLRTQKVRFQISARMVQKFKEQSQSPDFIRNLQYDLLKQGELVRLQDLTEQIEQLRGNMEGSPSYFHLLALRSSTPSLAAALVAKTWHVLETAPGKFFVISDCPVMTVEFASGRANPGLGFGRENTSVLLPITPRHLFVASPPATRWKPVGPPVAVDSTNLLSIRFAHERVYAHVNSSAIKALVDLEINRITFGKNAFVPANQN